jgi:hypothetical protein
MSGEYKNWSKNDLVREVVRLKHLLADQMEAAPGVGREVMVQGSVSSTTKKPFVKMRAGEAAWQMTPAQARQHALIILDAAVEAERDAATIAFVENIMGQDEQAAGAFLLGMREHRIEWIEEFRSLNIVVEQ